MKRIVCLILCTVLLLGLMSVGASAEGKLQLIFTGAAAQPGEEVEVKFTLGNNPGLKGVSGEVKFDESVLTYVGYTVDSPLGNWSLESFPEDHILFWTYDGFSAGQMLTYDGSEMVTLRFKVAEDAAPGDYPITMVLDPEYDAITGVEDNYVAEITDYEIVPGTVTVQQPAEQEKLQLIFSEETVKAGEEVEVKFTLGNNPGLKGVSGEVKFDESVLTYVDYTVDSPLGNWSLESFPEDHILFWTYDGFSAGQMLTYDGSEMVTLRFKVAEDAAPGDYPITMVLDPEYDAITGVKDNYVFEITDYKIVPGKVTVIKETLEDGYYLIGQKGWTVDDIDPEQKFEPNPNNAGEYLLETFLKVDDGIKVVQVQNGEIVAWYPDGMDNQYIVDTAHSGRKTIYFKTSYDNNWSEFGGYMWIDAALTGAEVYGSSVSLKGDIALNFFLIIPNELKEDEGAYVKIGTDKFLIKDAATRTVGDYTLYQFTVKMNAKQMNDEVTLQVFNGADEVYKLFNHTTGEDVTKGYVYSVQTYIEKTIATSTDEKLKALVKAMSDYGSLAQAFLDYNVANRAEVQGDLNSVTLDTVTKYKSTTTAGTATGVTYNGGSLVLKSTTAIRLYFTLDKGEIGDYTFKLGKKVVTPVETADGWMIEIANISAKDLDKVYTVTVSSSAGTIVTVKYCGLSYVYTVLNGGSDDAELIDLAKGIYLYNQAADAYFAK